MREQFKNDEAAGVSCRVRSLLVVFLMMLCLMHFIFPAEKQQGLDK